MRRDPYKGRPKPKAKASQAGSSLRQPTKQSDGSLPAASKGATEVKDEYLRGRSASPFSLAHYGKK